jgi:hypothetical protein
MALDELPGMHKRVGTRSFSQNCGAQDVRLVSRAWSQVAVLVHPRGLVPTNFCLLVSLIHSAGMFLI